jgi:hypothetical protein
LASLQPTLPQEDQIVVDQTIQTSPTILGKNHLISLVHEAEAMAVGMDYLINCHHHPIAVPYAKYVENKDTQQSSAIA